MLDNGNGSVCYLLVELIATIVAKSVTAREQGGGLGEAEFVLVGVLAQRADFGLLGFHFF